MKKIGLFLVLIISGFLFTVPSCKAPRPLSGKQFDVAPVFPGGEIALRKYVATNVKYPEKAQKEGKTGKVFVSFVIDRKGKVGNVTVAKGIDPLLDAEAVRVVAGMPKWQPGKNKEKVVKVQYTVPIIFVMQ